MITIIAGAQFAVGVMLGIGCLMGIILALCFCWELVAWCAVILTLCGLYFILPFEGASSVVMATVILFLIKRDKYETSGTR